MKLRKVRWAMMPAAAKRTKLQLRNISVSSVFYDRTRGERLSRILVIFGLAVISAAQWSLAPSNTSPSPLSSLSCRRLVARHPVCSPTQVRYPLSHTRPRTTPSRRERSSHQLCHPLACTSSPRPWHRQAYWRGFAATFRAKNVERGCTWPASERRERDSSPSFSLDLCPFITTPRQRFFWI